MKIKLRYPVRGPKNKLAEKLGFQFSEVDEVTLRRIKVKDFVGLNLSNPDKVSSQMPILVSRITNLTIDQVAELDYFDYKVINDAVENLLLEGMDEIPPS